MLTQDLLISSDSNHKSCYHISELFNYSILRLICYTVLTWISKSVIKKYTHTHTHIYIYIYINILNYIYINRVLIIGNKVCISKSGLCRCLVTIGFPCIYPTTTHKQDTLVKLGFKLFHCILFLESKLEFRDFLLLDRFYTKVKQPNLFFYLTVAGGRLGWFILFSRVLAIYTRCLR